MSDDRAARFNTAFAQARKAGLKEFVFDGKPYTTQLAEEVAKPAPVIKTPVKNLERLDSMTNPESQSRARALMQALSERSIPGVKAWTVAETLRSAERQNQLADEGSHRTTKRGAKGMHVQGRAMDAYPILDATNDISRRYEESPEAWDAYGTEAEKQGMTWGGRWKNPQDYTHVQYLRALAMQNAARNRAMLRQSLTSRANSTEDRSLGTESEALLR